MAEQIERDRRPVEPVMTTNHPQAQCIDEI